MRYLVISLTLFLFACKDETKTNKISQVNREIVFKSFFDQGIIPEILQLDSLYNSEFEKWTEFISFSVILNDMSEDDKNHRIMISSLSNKLDNIEIDKIPDPFNTPPIIGRTKVLKTFVEKIYLSSESEFSKDEYSDDIKKICSFMNFSLRSHRSEHFHQEYPNLQPSSKQLGSLVEDHRNIVLYLQGLHDLIKIYQ